MFSIKDGNTFFNNGNGGCFRHLCQSQIWLTFGEEVETKSWDFETSVFQLISRLYSPSFSLASLIVLLVIVLKNLTKRSEYNWTIQVVSDFSRYNLDKCNQGYRKYIYIFFDRQRQKIYIYIY